VGIKIRKGYKEDFEEWDNFLIRSDIDHVLQSSVMGKVWESISFKPFLVVAEEKNDIVGGLMSHIWFGNNKLFPFYRPFSIFRSQYGPIVSNNSNRLSLLRKIINFVDKEVEKQKYMQHIISTHYTWGDAIFRGLGYKLMPYGLRCTFITDLQQSEESLLKAFKKKTRYGVRKAEKYGVEIKEGVTDKTPKLFYYIYLKTTERLGIVPDPYSFVEGIWSILVPKGHAKFFFAFYNNKPIATLLFLIFNKKLYTYMSGSLEEYHRYYPNNLLYWRMLEYGLKNGFQKCDLMGAPGPEEKNHPEYGLYIFKRGWGGEMVGIRFFSKVFSPKSLYFWKLANTAMNKLPKIVMLLER